MMIEMTNEATFAKIIALLDEVTRILTKEVPLPDMDVSEWNQTPIGRAVAKIGDALELLEDLP